MTEISAFGETGYTLLQRDAGGLAADRLSESGAPSPTRPTSKH